MSDALIKSLNQAGISVVVDSKAAKTILEASGTRTALLISERVNRREHTATRAEAQARDRYYNSFRQGQRGEYPTIPRFDFEATGRLTITAGGYPHRNWNDTANTNLEERMDEVVAGIVTLLETIRVNEAESARKAEVRRIAQEAYDRKVQRRENERRRFGALQRDAALFRRATQLRAYVVAVEESAQHSGRLTLEQQEWILWARAKADWIDPLISVSDLILDAPEPQRPSYW